MELNAWNFNIIKKVKEIKKPKIVICNFKNNNVKTTLKSKK